MLIGTDPDDETIVLELIEVAVEGFAPSRETTVAKVVPFSTRLEVASTER